MLTEKLAFQEVRLPSCGSTGELKEQLFQQYPELREINFSIAVNRKVVQGDASLQGNEEIALLPPFSGG